MSVSIVVLAGDVSLTRMWDILRLDGRLEEGLQASVLQRWKFGASLHGGGGVHVDVDQM